MEKNSVVSKFDSDFINGSGQFISRFDFLIFHQVCSPFALRFLPLQLEMQHWRVTRGETSRFVYSDLDLDHDHDHDPDLDHDHDPDLDPDPDPDLDLDLDPDLDLDLDPDLDQS